MQLLSLEGHNRYRFRYSSSFVGSRYGITHGSFALYLSAVRGGQEKRNQYNIFSCLEDAWPN